MTASTQRIHDEIRKAKDNIARSAAESGEDLTAEFRRLRDELAAIKQTLADLGRTAGAQAQAAASNIAAEAPAAAQEFAAEAKADAKEWSAKLEKVVRDNPHYALGGAFGLGLVLALMLRRR